MSCRAGGTIDVLWIRSRAPALRRQLSEQLQLEQPECVCSAGATTQDVLDQPWVEKGACRASAGAPSSHPFQKRDGAVVVRTGRRARCKSDALSVSLQLSCVDAWKHQPRTAACERGDTFCVRCGAGAEAAQKCTHSFAGLYRQRHRQGHSLALRRPVLARGRAARARARLGTRRR